jgi:NitT/TauT family transport system substrate-binding protein
MFRAYRSRCSHEYATAAALAWVVLRDGCRSYDGAAGAAVVAAVTSGAYEFGKGSVVSAFRAFSRGIPLVAVAPGWIFEEKTPSAEMIVAADSPYRTGADLSGKTIAVSSLNELNQVAAMAWVDQHGGDSKTLKFVELPVVASAAAVAAHRIDATVLLEPALSAALSAGTVRSIGSAFAAIAPTFPVSVWLTNRAFAVAHPAQVKAYARALAEASDYLNVHPEVSEQLLSTAMHVPLETLKKMKHVRVGTTLSARMLEPLLVASEKYVAMPKLALDDFLAGATGR